MTEDNVELRVTESNVELARRGWEAALRGDSGAIEKLLDPGVKWHGGDPTAKGACRNREQALQFIRRTRGHRPLTDLVDVVGAGDKVVAIISRPSEHGSRELVANLTTFRGGKAVEMVHYADPNDALAAAGL